MSYLRAKTLLPLCPSYLHKHFKTNNQTNEKYNLPGGNLKKKKKMESKYFLLRIKRQPPISACGDLLLNPFVRFQIMKVSLLIYKKIVIVFHVELYLKITVSIII